MLIPTIDLSDRVLNIAYNFLAGVTCLELLEYRRNDDNYRDALSTTSVPNPITADDFCCRFAASQIDRLQEVFIPTRLKVWQQQVDGFFEEVCVDGDRSMITTTGECIQGIAINLKSEWGYHPLLPAQHGAWKDKSG